MLLKIKKKLFNLFILFIIQKINLYFPNITNCIFNKLNSINSSPCKIKYFHSICNLSKQIHKSPHKIYCTIFQLAKQRISFEKCQNHPIFQFANIRYTETHSLEHIQMCETKHHESSFGSQI